MSAKPRITIVGAGLVGSLLAILLARRGYKVDVVERRPDPRSGRVVGGRSINLALSDRGLLALDKAGIRAQIEAVAIPMKGRMTHAVDGATAFLPYGVGDQAIRSVSRGGLNTTLIELAGKEKNVRLVFERRVVGGDPRRPTLVVESATETGTLVELDTDILIGSDGAFSAVRLEMQKLVDRFDYSQEFLAHGYKELTIPAASNLGGAEGAWKIEKGALHIWPRSSFMLIALPNLDGSFTCTLFFALDGAKDSFAALDTTAKARAFFERVFPDALALMKSIGAGGAQGSFERDWEQNPVSSLVTVKCKPWCVPGKAMLIGDAAHAIVPFFGQGMNAGFEDCRVLMEILDETNDDWPAAMRAFEERRKENADAIALLALENFVEMRDKVSDPAFLLEKRIERRLATLCPELVTPKYTMVTFTPELPYSEALRRGRALDGVLAEASKIRGIVEDLDSGVHDDALRTMARARLA